MLNKSVDNSKCFMQARTRNNPDLSKDKLRSLLRTCEEVNPTKFGIAF